MSDGRRIKETMKLSSTRKFIGKLMSGSLRDYPQTSGSMHIATDNIFALKDKLKAENKNVTMTALFVKLVAGALKEYPRMNSALIGEELLVYESVNIGVGVGLDTGIMTVVIKEAQDKTVFEIADELKQKIDLLSTGKLPFADMKGSTFTISNVGTMGFETFTPILNPPETGMMGIGAAQKVLIQDKAGNILAQTQTCFNVTSNHAAVDGYHGGQFMGAFVKILAEADKNLGI